ncbi:MAG TPA: hypothetical protein VFY18_07305 [Candidatus Limnocylindrales bacterium]|nr:hypothetical protein [Candidatus Limnocylindrales bacterium]
MSATTRTIQKPISHGSIFGAVLMAAAVLLAVVAIAWGSANLVATKTVAYPVPVQIDLDRGGRNDLLPAGAVKGNQLKDDNAFSHPTSGGPRGFRAQ